MPELSKLNALAFFRDTGSSKALIAALDLNYFYRHN